MSEAVLDPRDRRGNLARDELPPTPWALVIEEDARAAVEVVALTEVATEIMAGDLADRIGATRMERGQFALRSLPDVAEHLRGASEVELAVGSQRLQRSEHVLRTLNVRGHRREPVLETLDDEALGGQVVAFVERHLREHLVDRSVVLERRGVDVDVVQDVPDATKTLISVFERDRPDDSVHLVAEAQQMLREVASVLTGNTGDQCSGRHTILGSLSGGAVVPNSRAASPAKM